MRAFDPEPNAPSEVELLSPAQDVVAATAWLRCFTEYHGAYQASAMYPYYQILTGRRFVENYYHGALIAGRLRDQLPRGVYPPAAGAGRTSPGPDRSQEMPPPRREAQMAGSDSPGPGSPTPLSALAAASGATVLM